MQVLMLQNRAQSAGVTTVSSGTPSACAASGARWTVSHIGRPKPDAPTIRIVWFASGGMTGSWAACAFNGSRLAPSASTIT